MSNWLIKVKEDFKEYKDSRYREQPVSLGLKENIQRTVCHPHGPGLRSRPLWTLLGCTGWLKRCWDASLGVPTGNCPWEGAGPWNPLQSHLKGWEAVHRVVIREEVPHWRHCTVKLLKEVLGKLLTTVRGRNLEPWRKLTCSRLVRRHNWTLQCPSLISLTFLITGKGQVFAGPISHHWASKEG